MLSLKGRWLVWVVLSFSALADWPTYMGDSARSGISIDKLELSSKPAWVFETAHPPSPGFYTSLSTETLGTQKILAMANTYDYAHAPILSGGCLYFGSSTEEALFCLDAVSGKELWRFYAEGAIRLAGTVWNDSVLFGSDDGRVYCLDAVTGSEKWTFNAAPEDRRITANGRPASQWPVRTSVTIDEDGTAYFSAGLFPASGGVHLYAVNAKNGDLVWQRQIALPPQGYILKKNDILYVPNGRASPAEYRAADGSSLYASSDLRREGGSSFVSLADDMVTYGPTEFGIVRFQAIQEGAADRRKITGKLAGLFGRRALFENDTFYFLREDTLQALPREAFRQTLTQSALLGKKRARVKSGVQMVTDAVAEKEVDGYLNWDAGVEKARSMILAGSYVVVGAENRLYVFDKTNGENVLDVEVDGTVWELAASDGRLYASTDKGKIYCFGKTAERNGIIAVQKTVPYSAERLAATRAQAEAALKEADTTKGFALVIDLVDGALVDQLARQSELFVIGVTDNSDTARTVRDQLVKSGLYGARVVVHTHPEGTLPYASYFANLILSEGADSSFKAEDVARLLQPYGGVQIAGDGSVNRRGPLKGAGDWTHMFADPANTSCSGDERVGGTRYRVQWFGNPSDFKRVGWHHNGLGPLYQDGRLYIIKVNSVEAVDSYNGTLLWQRDIPNAARFNSAREGGAACVDHQRLYMAVQNDCQVFDVETGEKIATYWVPENGSDWGYIARAGDLLFGTAQKKGVSQTTTGFRAGGLRALWNASEPELAVSERLFALHAESGKPAWTYGDDARVVLNSTITLGDDYIYFVESRKKEIVEDSDGSVLLRNTMDQDIFLVALNRKTGVPIWEQPFEFPARTSLYLSLQDDTLVASGGYHIGPMADAEPSLDAASKIAKKMNLTMTDVKKTLIHFIFQALDAKTGEKQWDAGYTSSGYFAQQHNYTVGHPVITKTHVWHAPGEQYIARVDLETGGVKEYPNIKRSKGCSTPTGSARAMFYRSLAITSFDFESERQFYVSQVNRPSCWMNILPAGGLVQMPEYSYGCNCAFPLQTSIVLIPEGE